MIAVGNDKYLMKPHLEENSIVLLKEIEGKLQKNCNSSRQHKFLSNILIISAPKPTGAVDSFAKLCQQPHTDIVCVRLEPGKGTNDGN